MKPRAGAHAIALLSAAAALVISGACTRETPAPPADAETSALASSAMSAASPGSTASTSPTSPQQLLDRMDRRSPVPLLPMMAHHQKENMRDHLSAVQEIVTALASEDFAGVEKAALRIGYSERMGQMCNHMGAGAPGFTKQALEFHRTADRITEAARDKDRGRVLSELGATLKTCTSCHSVWKQDVVSEAEWSSRAGAAPPVHSMH